MGCSTVVDMTTATRHKPSKWPRSRASFCPIRRYPTWSPIDMSQVVVGLGNPGGEYARTRHNTGWMVLNRLEKLGHFTRERKEGRSKVQTGDIEGFDIELVRPQTYMNDSGKAAAE